MGLPKTLQINEEGDITNPDECNLFIAGVDPFEIEVGTAMVARYNAHTALMELYKTAAEMRMLGYQFPLGLTVKLNAVRTALKGATDEQTRT
jgi:purine nucleoside permease